MIGYIAPADAASKAMSELMLAEPLGRHVVVRVGGTDRDRRARGQLPISRRPSAPRRSPPTAATSGPGAAPRAGPDARRDRRDRSGVAPAPDLLAEMAGFSERNRELMTLALGDRLAAGTRRRPPSSSSTRSRRRRGAAGSPPTRTRSPSACATCSTRARRQDGRRRAGRRVRPVHADQASSRAAASRRTRAELDNLLVAYPGNAALHQLRCRDRPPRAGRGGAGDAGRVRARAELAPGDPAPHLAVAEALAGAADPAGARAELAEAERKIANLPAGAPEAWRRVIALYQGMGALAWTEDAIARAGLTGDPVAQQVAQVRARYGVPRGKVPADQEAALVKAVRDALDLVYANQLADAERALVTAERRWPVAARPPGRARDLELRRGQAEAARAACARALAADPRASWALYLSGVLALSDTTTAGTRAGIERLKQAIAVDPELGQAWRTLAKAYARAKDRPALEQLGRDYAARFGQPLPPDRPRLARPAGGGWGRTARDILAAPELLPPGVLVRLPRGGGGRGRRQRRPRGRALRPRRRARGGGADALARAARAPTRHAEIGALRDAALGRRRAGAAPPGRRRARQGAVRSNT